MKFSAEAFVDGRKRILIKSNMIEVLRLWLGEFLNRNPYAGIELVLDDLEGMLAKIKQ